MFEFRSALISKYIFVIATVSRFLITAAIIASIKHSVAITILLLSVFIAVDILDGVWARKHNADSRIRRMADATTDGLSVVAIGLYFIWNNQQFVILHIPLLIRDFIVFAVCGYSYLSKNVLIIGGYWHKYSSISKAAFFISMLFGDFTIAAIVAFLTWIINYLLLVDYLRGFFSTPIHKLKFSSLKLIYKT